MQSVLDSAYTDVEVIVNDDASTDNTAQIVERFRDDRIRFYRNETNQGAPQNWNRALEKASGEFIALLNHDDIYGPFWLSFAVHTLKKDPHIGWVGSAYRVIDSEGHMIHIVSRFPRTGVCNTRDLFLCLALFFGLGPFFVVRRNVIERVGGYDERTGPAADTDLFLRLALVSPLYYSSQPHVAKRQHGNNLARRSTLSEQTDHCLTILDKVFSREDLSQEIRDCERVCYLDLYRRVVHGARKLLQQGDIETVQEAFLATDRHRMLVPE